jgi:transglutaminase-like putative cysteine protease
MRIRAGYELIYDCPTPTPMLMMISVHASRAPDLLTSGEIIFTGGAVPRTYEDRFGNLCTRTILPAGRTVITTDFVIADSGLPDDLDPTAEQHPIGDLPDDILLYLLGSRYAETDKLSNTAWALFGHIPPGWARVQAICQFVHEHIRFDYQLASSTRSAWDAYQEGVGVCRDFAHLALTFCRCMNIPARYCTGYMGDIGVPLSPDPMDFSGWFEAYLGGRWYTFDARHNRTRIGRILMAVGRDATDVPISNAFGTAVLSGFTVITEELPDT